MERVGVFGGSFDPPHLGHVILACEAADQLNLGRVLWLPTAQPPHKIGLPMSALVERLEMVQRTIADYPQFEISRVEIDRLGPHYAADTMQLLLQTWPQVEWVYIMGGDSLGDLPKWSRPQLFLAQLTALGVLRRPGFRFDMEALEAQLPGVAAKVHWVDAPQIEISATRIRQLVARNGPYACYLPRAVKQYIEERGLYR